MMDPIREPKYEALLFDVGETLLTKEPSEAQILIERCRKREISLDLAAAHAGYKQSEIWVAEQILREMAGAPRMPEEAFSRQLDYIRLRTAFDREADEVIGEMVASIQSVAGQKQTWRVIEGVYETLSMLKGRYRLGVVSNFDPTLSQLLESVDLLRYFETIIVSSLIGIEKPDPKILEIACSKLEIHPEDALYIGDHPFDVLCAKEAGMPVVWICEESGSMPEQIEYEPDYRVHTVREIDGLLT